MIVRFEYGEPVELVQVLEVQDVMPGTWVSIAEILDAWSAKKGT